MKAKQFSHESARKSDCEHLDEPSKHQGAIRYCKGSKVASHRGSFDQGR